MQHPRLIIAVAALGVAVLASPGVRAADEPVTPPAAAPATSQPATNAPAATTPTADAPASTTPAAPAAKQPDALSIYFDTGSATVRQSDMATLDQASRLYRDGKPIVMIVSGSTDSTGTAVANLRLSQLRADAVVRELIARGIPAERFQIVGKGETELAVPTANGVAEPRNRRAEITWR